jgi:hypothetical protein
MNSARSSRTEKKSLGVDLTRFIQPPLPKLTFGIRQRGALQLICEHLLMSRRFINKPHAKKCCRLQKRKMLRGNDLESRIGLSRN